MNLTIFIGLSTVILLHQGFRGFYEEYFVEKNKVELLLVRPRVIEHKTGRVFEGMHYLIAYASFKVMSSLICLVLYVTRIGHTIMRFRINSVSGNEREPGREP